MGEAGKHGGFAWEVESLGFSEVTAFSADRLRPAKPYFSAQRGLDAAHRIAISPGRTLIALCRATVGQPPASISRPRAAISRTRVSISRSRDVISRSRAAISRPGDLVSQNRALISPLRERSRLHQDSAARRQDPIYERLTDTDARLRRSAHRTRCAGRIYLPGAMAKRYHERDLGGTCDWAFRLGSPFLRPVVAPSRRP